MSIIEKEMAGLPLNTSRIYVRGKCKSGCEIFIPVQLMYTDEQQQAGYEEACKDFLQELLDKQPAPNVYNFPPRSA